MVVAAPGTAASATEPTGQARVAKSTAPVPTGDLATQHCMGAGPFEEALRVPHTLQGRRREARISAGGDSCGAIQ
jgi:hypothetical protein